MNLDKPWSKSTLIAIDLETSGRYPIESEICEMAAVKWVDGEIVDEYQTLVKPQRKMSDEVIAIHNITNEMVQDAPPVEDVIEKFHSFISDGIVVGHHSPFDLGFLTIEFEKVKLPLPTYPAMCSSLLSRQLFPEAPNHKLKTLVQFLKLSTVHSHRAMDDTLSCLALILRCLERFGTHKTWNEIFEFQMEQVVWPDYSLNDLCKNKVYRTIVEALRASELVQITYDGGSRKGQARTIRPIGLVRKSDDRDFLVAIEDGDSQTKRYFLNKISASAI